MSEIRFNTSGEVVSALARAALDFLATPPTVSADNARQRPDWSRVAVTLDIAPQPGTTDRFTLQTNSEDAWQWTFSAVCTADAARRFHCTLTPMLRMRVLTAGCAGGPSSGFVATDAAQLDVWGAPDVTPDAGDAADVPPRVADTPFVDAATDAFTPVDEGRTPIDTPPPDAPPPEEITDVGSPDVVPDTGPPPPAWPPVNMWPGEAYGAILALCVIDPAAIDPALPPYYPVEQARKRLEFAWPAQDDPLAGPEGTLRPVDFLLYPGLSEFAAATYLDTGIKLADYCVRMCYQCHVPDSDPDNFCAEMPGGQSLPLDLAPTETLAFDAAHSSLPKLLSYGVPDALSANTLQIKQSAASDSPSYFTLWWVNSAAQCVYAFNDTACDNASFPVCL